MINMLIGAALVITGVLASALADRIRDLRFERRQSRDARKLMGAWQSIVSESQRDRSELRRAELRHDAIGDQVVTALETAGYKRALAKNATWACSPSERATLESWTKAALRYAGSDKTVST